jgi:hypothetical protein
MFIVLSNEAKGNNMEHAGITETQSAAPDEHVDEVRSTSYDGSRWRAPSHHSRRAAAIEAAYILEAVRK